MFLLYKNIRIKKNCLFECVYIMYIYMESIHAMTKKLFYYFTDPCRVVIRKLFRHEKLFCNCTNTDHQIFMVFMKIHFLLLINPLSLLQDIKQYNN